MISEYLTALKEARGYSNQKIAEKSGVSLSTIERILSGKSKSTSFEVLRDITFALEGNMDDLAHAVDATPGVHPETWGRGPELPIVPDRARDLATAADLDRLVTIYTDALHERDEIYAMHTKTRTDAYDRALVALRETHRQEINGLTKAHEREVRSKDRWITIMAVLSVLCVAAMIIMMIAAIRNPAVNLFGT